MDLDISMRTVDCFFTVTFYGALFREVKYVAVVTHCSDVVIGLIRLMIRPYRKFPPKRPLVNALAANCC